VGAGVQGNAESYSPRISGDGRYVAFVSLASNLVSGDTNNSCAVNSIIANENCSDVFMRDRLANTTTRVSLATGGGQGNSWSYLPALSPDGRYVAFNSLASNLVSGDSNNFCDNDFNGTYHENCDDLFVHDRQTGTTSRVSVSSNGAQANAESGYANLSANGRYVTFHSLASNLVFGDSNNFCDLNFDGISGENCVDSFVHDRESGVTTRVSVNGTGGQGSGHSSTPVISAGGDIVAFDSDASNLVPFDGNLCDMDGDPAADPCLDVFQHLLADADSDGAWDPFDWDTDSDADLIVNPLESKCESNPLNAISRPERIDTPGDEDGDGLVNEALAGLPGAYDCDGDGYTRSAESNVTTSDQDPCGRTGWPSDLSSTIFSTLDLQDLGSFVAPVRRLGTSPGDPRFNARWDLVPGSVVGPAINVQDIGALSTGASGYPPMLGGQRAFGLTCPFAP
jgi:hypothetical protein